VAFTTVVADAGYGDNPQFLVGLEERGVSYICGVECTFGVRRPDEVEAAAAVTQPPAAARRGQGRPKLPRPAPLHTAEAVVAALPEESWRLVTWRDASKGPLQKQFVAVRVHRATGNPEVGPYGRSASHPRMSTGGEGWLLAERPVPGEEGERKWYYANLPADTPLQRLVQLAHSRWVIEQFYEDAKGECGLDDYQGRRWDGLHRHLALAMLTYRFLVRQRTAAGGLFPPPGCTGEPAGGASAGTRMAHGRPCAVVHRQRPDQVLSPSENLTK
jgi:SRSO17 transposase